MTDPRAFQAKGTLRGPQNQDERDFVHAIVGPRLYLRYGNGKDWSLMGGREKERWTNDASGLLDAAREAGISLHRTSP